MPPSNFITLVVYGTSLSAEKTLCIWRRCGGHWVTLLRRHLAEVSDPHTCVVNASRWGADSRWAIRNVDRRVLRHLPDAVVLEFAVNDADVRNGISLAEAEENTEELIERLGASKSTPRIWLMTNHMPDGRHRSVRPAVEEYYSMYAALAERHGVGLLDLYSTWGPTAPARQYLPDGIHTSRSAAEVILPEVLAGLGI